MTNEEIIKAAQNIQEDIGEYEKIVVCKSLTYGSALGIAICILMILIEIIFFKDVDFGKPAIIFAIAGYADLYEGIKNKVIKKKVKGSVKLVVAAFCILLYLGAF